MARSAEQQMPRQEACAVPFRMRDQRMEFCLVSAARTSRWEFPCISVEEGETAEQAVRRCVLALAGLKCQQGKIEPLDELTKIQNGRELRTIVFLLPGEPTDEAECLQRIRWCFAEEARARIRRKPLRRLIDLAARKQMDL